MLSVDSTSKSEGSWDINVTPRGLINEVVGKFITTSNYSDGNMKFSDKIKTDIKYEFLTTTRFKD
jgi:hypothetical protein